MAEILGDANDTLEGGLATAPAGGTHFVGRAGGGRATARQYSACWRHGVVCALRLRS